MKGLVAAHAHWVVLDEALAPAEPTERGVAAGSPVPPAPGALAALPLDASVRPLRYNPFR